MPQIVKDLHALGEYPLGFASFIASVLIFMPFAGPWADRYGSRRVLAIALGLLAAGLAAAALAPNIGVFVAARFIEGAGGGLDYALTFAVIAKTFDETSASANVCGYGWGLGAAGNRWTRSWCVRCNRVWVAMGVSLDFYRSLRLRRY